jgi:anti-sigma regulatory factor (Ser/Thr protein kinase)/putative methionine-R-sulfoxide reductase with GAF domain
VRHRLGVGQVVLLPAPVLTPSEQVRSLYRLSDPALSEMTLDQLLNELLIRVRDAVHVDTVAILLFDEKTNELVARAARGIEEEVERGVRIPIGTGFAGRIAAERVPIFIADVDHADIMNPILREKGIRSLLGVPLIVEGKLLGVLHVGSLVPRQFGQRDLAVLELAAARVGPAIERARLYSALEREHRVSMVLQRSLLPERVAQIAGLPVAARYLPAREAVGGDWYDLIELPRGLVGVVIGDVVGHGIKAAALMGQLRTALRAYAAEGHGPGRTLELVDRFAHGMSEPSMATAAYAVLDPETGIVRFAVAGHLPPIVVSPSGARVVDVAPAPPLGAFPYGSCTEHDLTLAAGEVLVLYTDGLVERRGTPLSQGIEQLARLLRGSASAEQACMRAIDALAPVDDLNDDVAIVALESSTVPEKLHLLLPADPKMLAQVRRMLKRWLRARGIDGELLTEATIAVSEACANAVEHAYSPAPASFELEAVVAGGELRVAVRDAGRWRSPRGSHRGRGLRIVEAAMDHVEVNRRAEGTEVLMRRRLPRR